MVDHLLETSVYSGELNQRVSRLQRFSIPRLFRLMNSVPNVRFGGVSSNLVLCVTPYRRCKLNSRSVGGRDCERNPNRSDLMGGLNLFLPACLFYRSEAAAMKLLKVSLERISVGMVRRSLLSGLAGQYKISLLVTAQFLE